MTLGNSSVEPLGFVAFAAFRTAADYDNAAEVWDELPDEIRAQWNEAAAAVLNVTRQ